jgi:hypothetical protein
VAAQRTWERRPRTQGTGRRQHAFCMILMEAVDPSALLCTMHAPLHRNARSAHGRAHGRMRAAEDGHAAAHMELREIAGWLAGWLPAGRLEP